MPVQVSYPGVYIQESTSTVHTITPVATSVTAFVGRARRGPVSTPTTITSWPDFQRQFGDFWPVQSRLAYSVYDFFTNGGSSAVIVRLFHYPSSSTTPPAECATAVLTPEGSPTEVTLYATSPGSWGGALTATVDYNTAPGSAADVFNLTIIDGNQPAWAPQKYFNVTLNQAEPTPATGVPQPTYLLTALQADPTALVNMEPVASGSTTPTAPTATNPNASTPVPPISFTAPSTPDGGALVSGDFLQPQASKTGLYALENTDLFNLLVIPPYTGADQYGNPQDVDPAVITSAAGYCAMRNAFLLIDAPTSWQESGSTDTIVSDLGSGPESALGTSSEYASPGI